MTEADMPEEAFAAAERDQRLDLLLTDVVLPRMSGRVVADAEVLLAKVREVLDEKSPWPIAGTSA